MRQKKLKVSIANSPPDIEMLVARLCELFLANKKADTAMSTNKK